RGILALVVGALLLAATVSAVTDDPATLGPGTVERAANGSTVISVQGFHFRGIWNEKKPARLVFAGPRGHTEWVYDGSEHARWFYDVDPLSNGNLLVTSTVPDDTVVFELDPQSETRVWTERLDAKDTHDVDLINGDQLLVANMREYNETTGVSNDRIFIYDRSAEEIVWQWTFKNHYPNSTDGGYSADWTHVNDIDKIGAGKFMVSPRNFDQVIVVNRSTGNITMRLGRDGNHDVLFEQHNPDYLVGDNGTPTILVADSENDRIAEYRLNGSEWERTWTLSGGLDWPRDADRLQNGNTLITDTLNHRVIEVTPTGEVVWEYYAPWAPYDAERLTGANASAVGGQTVSSGGSHGPTIAEMNVSGIYTLSGGGEGGPADDTGFSSWVAAMTAGTPLQNSVGFAAERYAHVVPFIRPVWLSSWGFAAVVCALCIAFPWLLFEVVYRFTRRYRLSV
ncbi:MAG TPA: aryl-sulfate sulfotransferase, partial [Halococcus sp.]|nr:aryl-sulfate sulfotransferase [Halococcus sp.]